MGQKVNPIGLRLGINRTWDSRWFADRGYGTLLIEDIKIRNYIFKRLSQAGVAKVIIERRGKKTVVTIHVSRPGAVIGRKGSDIDKLRSDVAKFVLGEVTLNIVEVLKPDIEARLVAESIGQQMERRVNYRRAMKRAIQAAVRLRIKGIKIKVSGRLGGAEIARMDQYHEGRVPLHTLRGDIDFGTATAHTAYGACGVKVWIYKGDVLGRNPAAQDRHLNMNSSSNRTLQS